MVSFLVISLFTTNFKNGETPSFLRSVPHKKWIQNKHLKQRKYRFSNLQDNCLLLSYYLYYLICIWSEVGDSLLNGVLYFIPLLFIGSGHILGILVRMMISVMIKRILRILLVIMKILILIWLITDWYTQKTYLNLHPSPGEDYGVLLAVA